MATSDKPVPLVFNKTISLEGYGAYISVYRRPSEHVIIDVNFFDGKKGVEWCEVASKALWEAAQSGKVAEAMPDPPANAAAPSKRRKPKSPVAQIISMLFDQMRSSYSPEQNDTLEDRICEAVESLSCGVADLDLNDAPDAVTKAVLEIATDTAEPAHVRASAVRIASRSSASFCRSSMLQLATDPEAIIREAAIDGLKDFIPPDKVLRPSWADVAKALRKAADNDPSDVVRASAAEAFAP